MITERPASGDPLGQVPASIGGDPLRVLIPLIALLGLDGFVQMGNSGAAAFYARDFGLSEAELARTFGWIALGAGGMLVVGRVMDRVGRRRVLLGAVSGLGVCGAASALAPGLGALVVAQILMLACSRAMFSAGTVIIGEELPTETRARGQAASGLMVQLGSGTALVTMAAVSVLPGSWRWGWALMVLPALALPWLRGRLKETARFKRAAERGEVRSSRARELFRPPYRRRTMGVLVTYALTTVSSFATMTWLLYHPETTLGLEPAVATAVVIAGGAAGLLGFPLGAYSANRFGRRATVLVFGSVFVAGNVSYYWVPADLAPSPVLGLILCFTLGSIGFAALTVGLRTAATELFPTRLRGTLQGVGSVVTVTAALTTQFSTAALVPVMDGLVPAISLLACLGVAGFVVFHVVLPETGGLELDIAALEQAPSSGPLD